MNIAYHLPSLSTIYAYRTIFNGYKNAFTDLGHSFYAYTADHDLSQFLKSYKIDIFITASHYYYQKYLDLKLLKKYRKKGLVVFTKIDFWNSPLSKIRINEAPSLKDEHKKIEQIKNGDLGDIFFHTVEQDDERMNGFQQATGKQFVTIPLACDINTIYPDFSSAFTSDIAYIGTNLPEKRKFFKETIYPLMNSLHVKLYGQDWTWHDKALGLVQKFGQLHNIPIIKNIQKPKLLLSDERKIYNSSKICVNVHEEYQKKFGGDCNERTFKIPAAEGFEIVDRVKCITNYFVEGKEIIIADNKSDWLEKIHYYLKNPDKKNAIIKQGRKKVLAKHTYHHRAKQFIEYYRQLTSPSSRHK